MGHEGCGAVGAAMLSKAEASAEPEHVQYLLDLIRPAVRDIPPIRDKKARMREAVINNVRLQVHELNQDRVIRDAVERGQIKVIGAFYEIGSGAVDFFTREEELALER
jgi:carbonic anhydrase